MTESRHILSDCPTPVFQYSTDLMLCLCVSDSLKSLSIVVKSDVN